MADKQLTNDAKLNDNQVGTVKSLTNDSIVSVISPVSAGASFFLLTHKCNVKRRAENPSANILNEPDYGVPQDWVNVYVNLPCRLEITSSQIQFKPTGERVPPMNVLYIDASTPLKVQDRVWFLDTNVTGLGVVQEFIVQGAKPALNMLGLPQHHLEYELLVP